MWQHSEAMPFHTGHSFPSGPPRDLHARRHRWSDSVWSSRYRGQLLQRTAAQSAHVARSRRASRLVSGRELDGVGENVFSSSPSRCRKHPVTSGLGSRTESWPAKGKPRPLLVALSGTRREHSAGPRDEYIPVPVPGGGRIVFTATRLPRGADRTRPTGPLTRLSTPVLAPTVNG